MLLKNKIMRNKVHILVFISFLVLIITSFLFRHISKKSKIGVVSECTIGEFYELIDERDVLIVYGSLGGEEQEKIEFKNAQKIKSMHYDEDISIKRDVDITAYDTDRSDIIIIGNPQFNELYGLINKDLPIGIVGDRILLKDKELKGQYIFRFCFENPLNTSRQMMIIGSTGTNSSEAVEYYNYYTNDSYEIIEDEKTRYFGKYGNLNLNKNEAERGFVLKKIYGLGKFDEIDTINRTFIKDTNEGLIKGTFSKKIEFLDTLKILEEEKFKNYKDKNTAPAVINYELYIKNGKKEYKSTWNSKSELNKEIQTLNDFVKEVDEIIKRDINYKTLPKHSVYIEER